MTNDAPALFAGLDVSLAETHICVVDGGGARIHEGMVPSDPEAIAGELARVAPNCASIAIETGATTPGSGASFASAVSR
jgi:hypothetical protein